MLSFGKSTKTASVDHNFVVQIIKLMRDKFGKRMDNVSYGTIIRFVRGSPFSVICAPSFVLSGFAKTVPREEKTCERMDEYLVRCCVCCDFQLCLYLIAEMA